MEVKTESNIPYKVLLRFYISKTIFVSLEIMIPII